MQWKFNPLTVASIVTILVISDPRRLQILSTHAPFNAPRISRRTIQSNTFNNNYSRPSNYQLSPVYYSMNNIANNNINTIDPFGGKSRRGTIILNSPGYSNQFSNQRISQRGGRTNLAPGVQFSRVNLGVPMVNLHQGKSKDIVVLGVQNMDPSRSIYQGNSNQIGMIGGTVRGNNGFPNNGFAGGVGPRGMGIPGSTGPGGFTGSVSGPGLAPGMGGSRGTQRVSVVKPLMVKN